MTRQSQSARKPTSRKTAPVSYTHLFCKKGYVNNCTDKNGGWALGCRIDGGQAEYVRVPFADQGLNKIPDEVTDRQALLVGDVLATGYWAAHISQITEDDTVLIIGAGPTGICTLLCVMLKKPKRIITVSYTHLDVYKRQFWCFGWDLEWHRRSLWL